MPPASACRRSRSGSTSPACAGRSARRGSSDAVDHAQSERRRRPDLEPVPVARAPERQARGLLADWRGLLANVMEGRQVLGALLAGPIQVTPIIEEARRVVSRCSG